jgi:hypothetical protein
MIAYFYGDSGGQQAPTIRQTGSLPLQIWDALLKAETSTALSARGKSR